MKKSILIIGSGVGGLATGIYGQQHGFATTIFESHSSAGGQCTSWNRKGYIFDGCMHYFGGGSTGSKLEAFWGELGVQPCEAVNIDELISFQFADGTVIHNYCDVDKLESHLLMIAPEDSKKIHEFVNGIKFLQKDDIIGRMMFGSLKEKLSTIPTVLKLIKYFKYTLGSYSELFKNPALKKAISGLHYSVPQLPLFTQLLKEANIAAGGVSWPVGGSKTIASRMVSRYQSLGGTIRYNKKVTKILTINNKAYGIELEDGSQETADFVVSNADGRKTIMQMLSGRFVNKKIIRYCKPIEDNDIEFAVQVFFGVKQDLSSHSPSSVIFLDKPVTICDLQCQHLDIQTYGYDTSMAPPGKGVIRVELRAKPSYLSSVVNDKQVYQSEKKKIADQVADLLDKKWPGFKECIEVIDVVTLHTWERDMGGTNGWPNWPNKKFSIPGDMLGFDNRYTLPGLKNFFFVGQWATSAGALLMNVMPGKKVIKKICKQSGIKY